MEQSWTKDGFLEEFGRWQFAYSPSWDKFHQYIFSLSFLVFTTAFFFMN